MMDGMGKFASLVFPGSIVVDSSRTLFFSDNYFVRRCTSAGMVTPVAGSGFSATVNGFRSSAAFTTITSLSVDDSGNIYTSEGNNYIRKIDVFGEVSTVYITGSMSAVADLTGGVCFFDGGAIRYISSSGDSSFFLFFSSSLSFLSFLIHLILFTLSFLL